MIITCGMAGFLSLWFDQRVNDHTAPADSQWDVGLAGVGVLDRDQLARAVRATVVGWVGYARAVRVHLAGSADAKEVS